MPLEITARHQFEHLQRNMTPIEVYQDGKLVDKGLISKIKDNSICLNNDNCYLLQNTQFILPV
ncbi:hypothetical protein [Marinicrinis sediminis]|uniref:Uncharacterized protein n=1 Tax=Marinicrinis sediminis TaxID=1652465 RepID=A0ABW5RBX9_9BACL